MSKLTRQQIHDYLDGTATPEERRQVLRLLSLSEDNRRRFDDEAELYETLTRGFAHSPQTDFSGWLPNILADANRPTPFVDEWNRRAMMLMMLLMVVIFYPLSQSDDLLTIDSQNPLFNVPAATPLGTTTVETREPLGLQSEANSVGDTVPELNLQFASPVPLPQTTLETRQPPD